MIYILLLNRNDISDYKYYLISRNEACYWNVERIVEEILSWLLEISSSTTNHYLHQESLQTIRNNLSSRLRPK